MEGKDGGLLGEAGKMFQPCSDSELQRLGHGVRASLHASFRSVSAWQRELDRIDGALNLAGGRNKWEAMGGTSPVFARNDVVVKLCPLLSEGNNSLAPIDSEVLARERILDADLVPPILSIGGYGNDKAEMAPWIAIARARGESLDSYRRRCARLGLQPTESNLASWLAQQTKSIHALPAIVDSSRMKDARGQREWRQLLARLWDGTLQKRLLRLPEADREPFAWLLKETSADKLLDALPENERARMLHADLHAGNVFGEAAGESWKPLQLIDFGDSFHAQNGEWFDVAWEFVPLFASILLRPEEVTDFMRTYGIHESREREVLRRVALYTLVWEFPGAVDSCVGRIEHGEPGGDPLLALFGEQIPL